MVLHRWINDLHRKSWGNKLIHMPIAIWCLSINISIDYFSFESNCHSSSFTIILVCNHHMLWLYHSRQNSVKLFEKFFTCKVRMNLFSVISCSPEDGFLINRNVEINISYTFHQKTPLSFILSNLKIVLFIESNCQEVDFHHCSVIPIHILSIH